MILGRIPRISQLYPTLRRCVVAHAYRMLIGAYNPMLCPIHVFRYLGKELHHVIQAALLGILGLGLNSTFFLSRISSLCHSCGASVLLFASVFVAC